MDAPSCTLVIPALDESASIDRLAPLVARVLATDLFDRAILVDGGSSDDTVARAHRHGIEVVRAADLAPGGPVLGKGDTLWRAADLPGDVLVCRDADVDGVDVDALVALARAACRPGVALAKGSFERLQYADGPPRPTSGRITEFVARPLLGLLAPELAHVVEPLSGQFAIRRDVLRGVEVVTRYGVDVGLVLAVAAAHGPAAVVSVDVGSLTHRAKQDASLVPMAHDVAATILGLRRPTTSVDAALTTIDDATGDAAMPAPEAVLGRGLPCAGPQGWLVVRPPRASGHATSSRPFPPQDAP